MTNRLRTWEEFEAERERLLSNIPIETSSLERILLQAAKKTSPKGPIFEERMLAPNIILILAREGGSVDRTAIAMEVQKRVYAHYFSDIVDGLTSVGISLAKQSEQGVLPEQERIRLYSYFTQELVQGSKTFSTSYPLTRDVPLVDTLLGYYFLPRLPEQVAVLKQVISDLSSKRYISKRAARNLVNLFYPEAPARTERPPVLEKTGKEAPPALSTPAEIPPPVQDVAGTVLYLTETLGVPTGRARVLSEKNPLTHYSGFYDSLSEIVGEEHARSLVQMNTGLLELPPPSQNKYLNTVRKILDELRAHSVRKPRLNQKLGLSTENLRMYSGLDSVIELKQRVFQSTRTFVNLKGAEESGPELDIDEYKNWLLGRAGMHVTMTRALTSGNNVNFVGNNILPLRHYRANSMGKVDDSTIVDRHFDPTVALMVKYGAMVKRNSNCYSFNERVREITNPYLGEYMRLTLHGDKILQQEGQLTLNQTLVQEFER